MTTRIRELTEEEKDDNTTDNHCEFCEEYESECTCDDEDEDEDEDEEP